MEVLRVAILTAATLALAGGAAPAAERAPGAGDARGVELALQRRFVAVRDAPGAELRPFVSDGCSGGLSAGWEFLAERLPRFREVHHAAPPWEPCCVAHDRAYHRGGARGDSPAAGYRARGIADQVLRRCVAAVGRDRAGPLAEAYGVTPGEVREAYRMVAAVIHGAVRLGGLPCTGLPWRWGYGWPECTWP